MRFHKQKPNYIYYFSGYVLTQKQQPLTYVAFTDKETYAFLQPLFLYTYHYKWRLK